MLQSLILRESFGSNNKRWALWVNPFIFIAVAFILQMGSVASSSTLSVSSITDSLVAHWAMEEGSGTMLIDSSTYANHAFTSGTPPWQSGPKGLSIFFNGVTQSAQAPSTASLNISNALTISAWIQPRWRY
jgi:hypothetical protein